MSESTMSAWVVTTSPLTIIVAGADTACPAVAASGLSLTIGDKVSITVRTPQIPLVTSIEVAV
jgi:hypothetical protein